MWSIGPVGFAAPWLLVALAALPILWLILRAVPPAPIRRRFPGVALLLGLTDDETQTDRTPWWLLLLRMLAVAAAIIGFAGPVLNPQDRQPGTGPLLVLLDGSWGEAADWSARMERVDALLAEAARDGRTVAMVSLTDDRSDAIEFLAADAWRSRLPGFAPQPWQPNADAHTTFLTRIADLDDFDTFWMSDGLQRDVRADVLTELEAKGDVTVFESARPLYALQPVEFVDGAVAVTALRRDPGAETEISVSAYGRDPSGVDRALAGLTLDFAEGDTTAEGQLSLPPELRNRVTRLSIGGARSAGAVTLTDDGLKRREVALIAGREDREGLELLSPLHFLEQALVPTADLIDGAMSDILLANPDVIILADVTQVPESADVLEWVNDGGMLLRFAGTRLAAAEVGRGAEDPLLPVRLRVGGRSVGGAMSWGEPKTIREFGPESPFFGLPVPQDVAVTAQVMAEPDPTLSERTIAALTDGTPLVTRKRVGDGQVVLFHVTANAEWSSVPLSGLFVAMLERLAVANRSAQPSAEDLEGTTWVPQVQLDGFGELVPAGTSAGIPGETLAGGVAGSDLIPGLYAGDDRALAVNAVARDTALARQVWPARIPVEGLAVDRETPLKGYALAFGLVLLLVDVFASLFLSGRLSGPRAQTAALVLAALVFAQPAEAQTVSSDQDRIDALALAATAEVVLAHVVTGDRQVDDVTAAGLRGISRTLFQRTAIEPADPIGVNIETDELSFFPFLYWPVTATQPTPSAEAYVKLNRYLRGGGMILFDTRDAEVSRFGANSPESRKLRELAAPLDIPPLAPIPQDHVLTRAFYLLQDFPGRAAGAEVWVEAPPADAEQIEGMPFRNLNDGVTPVVLGGNDWAAAWAIDRNGSWLYPVGRGFAGERQREISLRFGVNLIMHVLTGNYKSDQVHVPALLDRLGQ
ncbi:DUF4159 domain-containing protein [Shimia ponticola]|uniref:DUF4159 domain-containing protein n=1 Tax=Shimia ponticola TaxID=2582893 RepID=UPI0011BF6CD2|nr:DUF4159 domain-containing protein [Shimia ponticola]